MSLVRKVALVFAAISSIFAMGCSNSVKSLKAAQEAELPSGNLSIIGSWQTECFASSPKSSRDYYVFKTDGTLQIIWARWPNATCFSEPEVVSVYGQEHFSEGNYISSTVRTLNMTECDGDVDFYTRYTKVDDKVLIADSSSDNNGRSEQARADDLTSPRATLEPAPWVPDPGGAFTVQPLFCLNRH